MVLEIRDDVLYKRGLWLPLHRCSCGALHVVRDQVPIGLMDDGDGGTLVLYNCDRCRSTFSEEVRP